MPATNAAEQAASNFICRTLIPNVVAPVLVDRTAVRPNPVVDRRRFTMKIATTAKTAMLKYTRARSPEANCGRTRRLFRSLDWRKSLD